MPDGTKNERSEASMDACAAGIGSFPLVLASEGERVRIVGFRGGREFAKRMNDLGLPLGAEVVVMHRQSRGAFVLGHRDVRVGLGGGMAHKVLVAPCADQPA